jgi:hypothetical protein
MGTLRFAHPTPVLYLIMRSYLKRVLAAMSIGLRYRCRVGIAHQNLEALRSMQFADCGIPIRQNLWAMPTLQNLLLLGLETQPLDKEL